MAVRVEGVSAAVSEQRVRRLMEVAGRVVSVRAERPAGGVAMRVVVRYASRSAAERGEMLE
jgi:hypothetical protein